MSYPYPQDRTRDLQEKGEQPFKDAKEAMSKADTELENQVAEQNAPDSGPTSADNVSDEMIDRLRRVNEEIETNTRRETRSSDDRR